MSSLSTQTNPAQGKLPPLNNQESYESSSEEESNFSDDDFVDPKNKKKVTKKITKKPVAKKGKGNFFNKINYNYS